MARWVRSVVLGGVVVLTAGVLAGCELPPPVEHVVTSGGDGGDAVPGDGVCEAVVGGGDCTLRAAIEEANVGGGPMRIRLAPGVVVEPGEALPAIAGLVELDGAGATLRGRTLHHGAGLLTIRDLTVEGVRRTGGCGGGIESAGGALSLVGVVLRDNRVAGPGAAGGGVCASGRLSIVGSHIADNAANGRDASGGGVRAGGDLVVLGSTISGNAVGGGPGSRGAGVATNGGLLDVVVSTVSGNRGAVALDAPDATGRLLATTVTGNVGGDGALRAGPGLVATGSIVDAEEAACAPNGAPSSGGGNVVSDGTCELDADADRSSVDPQLGPLGDHDGATPTHVPADGSPARDVVPVGTPGACDGTLGNDQRGVARPQGGACDAGAVEVDGVEPPDGLELVVDDVADAGDATPGDGTCDTGAGVCTLRAAVDEANAAGRPVTVTIAEGIDPVLSIEGTGEDDNAGGDLDVRADLTIEGGGATIDASGVDRVVDHHEGHLVLRDVTVTGGRLTAGEPAHGGGILARSGIELHDVVVRGNAASAGEYLEEPPSSGGGVAVVGATATVVGGTIEGNEAAWENGAGGGLYGLDAEIAVEGTAVSGNRTGVLLASFLGGGGIAVEGSTLELTDVEVTENWVSGDPYREEGGGIAASDSRLHLRRTLVARNEVERRDIYGPGIALQRSELVAEDTVVEDNRGSFDFYGGGGIYARHSRIDMTGGAIRNNELFGLERDGGGGGLWAEDGEVRLDGVDVVGNVASDSLQTGRAGGIGVVRSDLVVRRSQVSGNVVVGETGADAGGIYAGDSTVHVVDTTIEGNRAVGYARSVVGGGLHLEDTEALVEGTTVSGNIVDSEWEEAVPTRGGGLSVVGGDVEVRRSTFSGNRAGTAGAAVAGPVRLVGVTVAGNEGGSSLSGGVTVTGSVLVAAEGADACDGEVTSGGWNVAADDSCALDGPGDRTGVDPLLGPPGDHGGPTATHVPVPGSPAVDAVPTGTPGLCDGGLDTDQRGTARPQGDACDAGSVEVEPA